MGLQLKVGGSDADIISEFQVFLVGSLICDGPELTAL